MCRFLILVMALLLAPMSAQAVIVGATIQCGLFDALPTSEGRVCDTDPLPGLQDNSFVITEAGRKPDVSIELPIGGSVVDFSFMGNRLKIRGHGGSIGGFSPGSSINFTGLFSQTSTPLKGINVVSITGVQPFGGGDGLTPDDFLFSARAGALKIDLSGVGFTPNSAVTVNFSAPVPLPAGGWLLLSALGALGLIARRRRIWPDQPHST